ncbi:hypothetical protein Tsubulata_002409 [Turnera subulata]|uniref:Uncharacterized protein n=1 Tax=Turnera subulata TaxID=218843 RepID=A0A9Q0JC96_9ROSI|nr:hypothetical protein Tsubulata_002409 [Turnera subulata]
MESSHHPYKPSKPRRHLTQSSRRLLLVPLPSSVRLGLVECGFKGRRSRGDLRIGLETCHCHGLGRGPFVLIGVGLVQNPIPWVWIRTSSGQ